MDESELNKISALAHALNEHYVGHFIRSYKLFNRDLEACILLGEIAAYNAKEIFARYKEINVENDEVMYLLKGCNSFSISMTTGIPRETVRRKVKKLKDLGLIMDNDKNQLVITRKLGVELHEFTQETLALFNEFVKKVEHHL